MRDESDLKVERNHLQNHPLRGFMAPASYLKGQHAAFERLGPLDGAIRLWEAVGRTGLYLHPRH